VAACGSDRNAGQAFVPATPGTLTVATAFLPAPGFWEGTPPVSGFEAALAKELAERLKLKGVAVKQVPFTALAAGDLGGADIALSQLTPTEKREQSLDFTTAYITAPPGIVARVAIKASDVEDLRSLRWVVSRSSTLTSIVKREVRPIRAPIEVQDRTDALKILRAGRADALLLDLPVALGLARDDPAHLRVLAQLPGEGALAAALPDGSANHEIVDSAIHRLQADGTIDRLVEKWLGEAEQDVPLIRTED
jgi:ABC-type amino acid transport substrate-binding protein